MDLAHLTAALEASRVAIGVRNSLYLFPLVESAHVIGLTLVFGTIAIIDLRLLGLASTRRPFTAVASDVLRWTWLAFAITVATGLLMFVTSAGTYYQNPYFRAKLALLLLSGVNMLAFELTARRSVQRWDQHEAGPTAARVVAAVSLTLWISVIVLGRWVGFTTASTPAAGDSDVDIEALEDLIPK